MDREKLRLLLLLAFIGITGFLFCGDFGDTQRSQMINETEFLDSGSIEMTEDESSDPTESQISETTSGTIFVYVCGKVNAPGVYELPEGARVYEALDLADGLTEEASMAGMNLADVLSDGEKIYVPGVDEPAGQITAETEEDDGLLDINTATSQQLQTLPGIGAAKADAIIAYREKNGAFGEISDLLKVTGIKEGVYSQIETLIKVD